MAYDIEKCEKNIYLESLCGQKYPKTAIVHHGYGLRNQIVLTKLDHMKMRLDLLKHS